MLEEGYKMRRRKKGVGCDGQSRTRSAEAHVQSRDRLGSLPERESGAQSEILSRIHHSVPGPESGRGREASSLRSSVHAGSDRVRLAHRVRVGEMFSLRWSDVDMEKNVLNLLAQLLEHLTVTVTMRYTHTNLESKRTAVAKLASVRDSCTKMQQRKS